MKSKKTTLLFPRFHQWELVTDLLATVKAEGAGNRYLAQHSAGSGKTNSIAWTAHGLSTLHDENNHKVFDSVIVVTDRTVLDDQLQKAIKQIEGTDGIVGDDQHRRGPQVRSDVEVGAARARIEQRPVDHRRDHADVPVRDG